VRRLALLVAAAALLVVAAVAPAHSPSHSPFPKLIALPDGYAVHQRRRDRASQGLLHELPRRRGLRHRLARRCRELTIGGDFVQTGGPTDTNLNGIAVAGRHTLILVQSNTGRLFAADARTGAARAIDLGGAVVMNGDGLLLRGRTLFAVQNRLNKIAVIRLSRDLARGRVVREP
jgi:hypothetical protein